jgi:2-keto-3-deoxy-L-rhamnonate aldolase RhmA
MLQGGKVTGGTLFSATDPATYCAMANAGYDFIWTEMQHDHGDMRFNEMNMTARRHDEGNCSWRRRIDG